MRGANRIRPWQRTCVDVAAAALAASGGVWLAVHYTVGAGAGELPSPAEPWAMRVHGAAAMLALFAAGLLAQMHIPHGWRLGHAPRWRPQRRTGLALCLLLATLVGTGWALYYAVPEPAREATGLVHSALGLAAAVALAWHRLGRPHRRG